MDLVVEALGQGLSAELRKALSDVELTGGGLIVTDPETMRTSREGVYAGGDVVNGGATVVQAVADGMKAAEAMNKMLMQKENA